MNNQNIILFVCIYKIQFLILITSQFKWSIKFQNRNLDFKIIITIMSQLVKKVIEIISKFQM